MNSSELRKSFLEFFKKRGHTIVPSSSLIPSDPSVLFTTAGMQQFTLYLQGEKNPAKDFKNIHLASCQKCFRSNDIEEVGDDTHFTFFEMLGNWSIGESPEKGYFKEGAIKYALEFLDKLGLDKKNFWVTVFRGDGEVSKDEESVKIWLSHGIPKERIREFGKEDNLWGPVGENGPCGPNSEIHYDRGEKFGCGDPDCGPNCPKCRRVVEIWNLVFMEYFRRNGVYEKMAQRNVDTGIGFERVLSILEKKDSAYETDLFIPVISELEKLSGRKYEDDKKSFRIISDHVRGAVFLISEGIVPSNVERGYVLRRLLRRAIRFGKLMNLPSNFLVPLVEKTIKIYKDIYPGLESKDILVVIRNEEEKFEKTLEQGLKEVDKMIISGPTGAAAFDIYQTYGFPLEMTEEIIAEKKKKLGNREDFFVLLKKHQEISRAGVEKKFGGVGEGATQESAKLHTATHLLHTALRKVLGEHVKQMGSDIAPQRLRFDFSHSQKMTKEEIEKVEAMVNEIIRKGLEVKKEEMKYQDAINSGALAFFKEKYPETVNVYTIGDFSKEICAGPHIKNTSELGSFKIIKEESSSAGVRRIRAVLSS
jgi:alanyl-tRNA synthetase